MANPNRPFGLRPTEKLSEPHEYPIDASAGTMYHGTPVVKETDGNIVPATAGAGNYILGSFCGYHASGAAGRGLVYDDPGQVFEIQADSVATTPASTDPGANIDFVADSSPNALCSNVMADSSSIGTGSTKQLRILDKIQSDSWGAYARYKVRINTHQSIYTTGV